MGRRLYADAAGYRLRQVAGDLALVIIVWLAVRGARRLREAIGELGVVAEGLDRSGRSVTGGAGRAVDAVEDIPAVGGALAAPFRTLGGAGEDLTAAGEQVATTVDTVALWLPFLLAVLLVGWVASRYVPWRVRWVAETTEVRRLLSSQPETAPRLLALRAASTRPLRTLHREVTDPATALAEERHAELAAVELRALGLAPQRLHPRRPARPAGPAPPR